MACSTGKRKLDNDEATQDGQHEQPTDNHEHGDSEQSTGDDNDGASMNQDQKNVNFWKKKQKVKADHAQADADHDHQANLAATSMDQLIQSLQAMKIDQTAALSGLMLKIDKKFAEVEKRLDAQSEQIASLEMNFEAKLAMHSKSIEYCCHMIKKQEMRVNDMKLDGFAEKRTVEGMKKRAEENCDDFLFSTPCRARAQGVGRDLYDPRY